MTSEMHPEPRPMSPSRRGVLRAAAWATPIVTLAATSPAFAASGPYDVTVTSGGFRNQANNWTNGTQSAIYGTGYLTWEVTICHEGPGVMPAGSRIDFRLGMGPYFDDFTILSNGGLPVSPVGGAGNNRSQNATMYNDDSYFRSTWSYLTTRDMTAGCHVFKLTARLRRQPIDGYNRVRTGNSSTQHKSYQIRTYAEVTPLAGSGEGPVANNSHGSGLRAIRVHVNDNESTGKIDGTHYDGNNPPTTRPGAW